MIEDEGARTAALSAKGAAALGTALLGCTDADGRLTLALTLSALVKGDWAALQAAAGWAAVIAVLTAAASTVSPTIKEFAEAAGPPLLTAVDDDAHLGMPKTRPAAPASSLSAPTPSRLDSFEPPQRALPSAKPVVRSSLGKKATAADLD